MKGSRAGFPGKNLVAPYLATTLLKSWFLAILVNLKFFKCFEILNLDFSSDFQRFLKISGQKKFGNILFLHIDGSQYAK